MSDYRFVTLSYPRGYWTEHGREIIETANEVHDGTWSFRESRHLLTTGLRTRSLAATGGTMRGTWISGLTIALFFTTLVGASLALLDLLTFTDIDLAEPYLPGLGALAALISMTFSTRWRTMAAVMASASFVVFSPTAGLTDAIFVVIIALGASLVAFAGNGRRVMSPATLSILLLVIVASDRWGWYVDSLLFLLPLLVVAVVLVFLDPRFAAALSLYCANISAGMIAITFNSNDGHMTEIASWYGLPTTVSIAIIAAVMGGTLAIGVTYSSRRLARS